MNVSINLKSITLLRPCIIISFLFIFITIINYKTVAQDYETGALDDLPKAKYLDKYLTALEKIVNFCLRHKIYVDVNFEFGLFLINVNLKDILEEKFDNVPLKARSRMEELLKKNKELEDYFHYMVQMTSNIQAYNQDRKISTLFYNDSLWPSTLYRFNNDLVKRSKLYSPKSLESIYGQWDQYETNVFDFEKFSPTPSESDMCISKLAETPATFSLRSLQICPTPRECKNRVSSGSEFGYGLSHRVLFLVVAHFGRGCAVFSEREDKYRVDMYCMKSFIESQYIAWNGFRLPDLMMEMTALCGLYGHAQYYRHPWISKYLESQTSEGCFAEGPEGLYNEHMKEGFNDHWTISSPSQSMMAGRCHGHSTAVAAATLAGALRYILENYY